MPRPISELITQDIHDTLETVKLVGGYHFDLTVERSSKVHVPKDSACVIEMDRPERDPNTCQGHETWFLPYRIIVYVAVSDAWEQTVQERLDLAYSDVMKALMADRQRAAMALNSWIDGGTMNNDGADMPNVEISYRVHYRHLWGLPHEL